jgi:hypothetical protein
MTMTPHFTDTIQWLAAHEHRKGWEQAHPHIKGPRPPIDVGLDR